MASASGFHMDISYHLLRNEDFHTDSGSRPVLTQPRLLTVIKPLVDRTQGSELLCSDPAQEGANGQKRSTEKLPIVSQALPLMAEPWDSYPPETH